MPEDDHTTVETYAHNCRIVREQEGDDEPRYHYEGPLGRVQSFYSLDRARLYADVQTVMGGFREEKTGERGVPPSVARARADVFFSYLVAQPTLSVQWVARTFDLEESAVREYVDMLRDRAEEQRGDRDGGAPDT